MENHQITNLYNHSCAHRKEIDGCALEDLAAQHLMAWNSYRRDKNKVYLWRTEVGFWKLILWSMDGKKLA
ncbi:MAG: hypothetical protein ABIK20_03770 [Candidatus Omnitrophota bacterium]|nr:hypothetical protein [Candidatus Omnitrophota bacterium]